MDPLLEVFLPELCLGVECKVCLNIVHHLFEHGYQSTVYLDLQGVIMNRMNIELYAQCTYFLKILAVHWKITKYAPPPPLTCDVSSTLNEAGSTYLYVRISVNFWVKPATVNKAHNLRWSTTSQSSHQLTNNNIAINN